MTDSFTAGVDEGGAHKEEASKGDTAGTELSAASQAALGEVEQAVRAVLDRYADAVYHGDVETLRKIFHPAASMFGYLGDKLLLGTPEPFLADIASHPAMAESGAPFTATFSAIAVAGRTATATLHETGFFGTESFVNYFHLLNDNGEWKIVCKTFESL